MPKFSKFGSTCSKTTCFRGPEGVVVRTAAETQIEEKNRERERERRECVLLYKDLDNCYGTIHRRRRRYVLKIPLLVSKTRVSWLGIMAWHHYVHRSCMFCFVLILGIRARITVVYLVSCNIDERLSYQCVHAHRFCS